ncbi:class A beta-lactamase [Streptomyces sp. NPDC004111]|uniref:class A beta-lactamase n=1 Tax=Streptomyces sp. NPDC004111 TaxID=3364690 RepID=UPI00368108BD
MAASGGSTRRAVLGAGAVLPLGLVGCGSGSGSGAPGSPSAAPPSASATATEAAGAARHTARFAALERAHGARLGVYALDTGSGTALAHRPDDRFAFCSTFKTLATAAVLHARPPAHLDKRVTFTRAEVNSISPVAEKHIGTGMTVRELMDAAVRHSDGTAGNLLMREIGGPAGLTSYLRGLGDSVSRMDQYEPELNNARPGDPRNTTTPRAAAGLHRGLLLGDALPARQRALLKDWLLHTRTGQQRILAGVPASWTVAHKTGTGNYGRANDIAVLWPPRAAPLVLVVLTDRAGYEAEPKEALIAETARYVVSVLAGRA